jgi:hypothetical protein
MKLDLMFWHRVGKFRPYGSKPFWSRLLACERVSDGLKGQYDFRKPILPFARYPSHHSALGPLLIRTEALRPLASVISVPPWSTLPLDAVRGEAGAGRGEAFRAADMIPLAVMHDRV